MPRLTMLLALALTACPGPVEDTGTDGSDSADTGPGDDTAVEPAECVFVSIDPLVASWNGGDELTVTLDCNNPKTTGLTLHVGEGEGSSSDFTATADGRTLTATFRSPAQGSTGPRFFDIDVDGETVTGDVLRFRLDPDQLDQGVDANPGPAAPHFGLSSLMISLRNTSGKALVVGTNRDGAVVTGTMDALGNWEGETLDVTGDAAGQITTFTSDTAHAAMVPMLGADGNSVDFVFAISGQKNRRTELKVLDFDHVPLSSSADASTTTSTTSTTSDKGTTSDTGRLSVASATFQLDDKDELSQFDVILLGRWTQDGGSPVTSMSLVPGKDGALAWTTNWQGSLGSQVLHVSPTLALSDGTSAVLVLSEGVGDGVVATWLSTSGGKTLSTQTLKDLTGTPLAISTTPVSQEKGDSLAVTLLDEDGGLFLLQAGPDPSEPIGIQPLALGGHLIARAIKAEVRRLVDTTRSPDWGKRGGFRTLEPGSKLFFPPLQTRSTTDGDLHIALTAPMDRAFSTGPQEGLLVASWLAEGGTANLGGSPDAVALVAAGGRSLLSGGPGEKLTGPPVLYNGTAYRVSTLGTLTADATPEVVLAADGGWTVLSRGGQVVVVDPDGKEIGDLPIDGTAGIQAYRTPSFRKEGRMCLLSGMVQGKSADGGTVSTPGLLTVSAAGVGVATFADDLSSCSLSRDESGDRTALCTTEDEQGRFHVGLGLVSEWALPDAGQETVLDLGFTAWAADAEHDLAGLPAVWASLKRDACEASWGVDDVQISVLGAVPGGNDGPDLVTVMPYQSDLACPLATWLVPGSTSDLAKNLSGALLLSTSDEADCSDLALPEAALDLAGEGACTLLMSQPSDTEGSRELFEMVWDQDTLLALPTITVPEWTSLEVGDFDSDGLDELLIQLGAGSDDGAYTDTLSGLMLRGGGRWHLGQEIRQEVIGIKNTDSLPPPGDDDTVFGAVYELSDSDLDALLMSGTSGRGAKHGGFTTVGVGNQPAPVILSSWGAVLE